MTLRMTFFSAFSLVLCGFIHWFIRIKSETLSSPTPRSSILTTEIIDLEFPSNIDTVSSLRSSWIAKLFQTDMRGLDILFTRLYSFFRRCTFFWIVLFKKYGFNVIIYHWCHCGICFVRVNGQSDEWRKFAFEHFYLSRKFGAEKNCDFHHP